MSAPTRWSPTWGGGAEWLQVDLATVEAVTQPPPRNGPNRLPLQTDYTARGEVTFRTTLERAPVLIAGALRSGATRVQEALSSPREEEIDTTRD